MVLEFFIFMTTDFVNGHWLKFFYESIFQANGDTITCNFGNWKYILIFK